MRRAREKRDCPVFCVRNVAAAATALSKLDMAAGSTPILDELPTASWPWYGTSGNDTFQPANLLANGATILSSDRPWDGPPTNWKAGGQLDHMYLQFNFDLAVSAQTDEVPKTFVNQSDVSWAFNGDGAITPGTWVWAPDAAAKVTPPTAWSAQITTGASPVVSGNLFNDLLRGNADLSIAPESFH